MLRIARWTARDHHHVTISKPEKRMQPINRILVAVKDPHARSQRGVEKAIGIARTLDASIEFFHALSNPVLLDVQPLTGTSLSEIKHEALTLARQQLDRL